ncbi:MAG: hypothetical protein D5R96_03135 [Methanocalculus sp. MSAO_Arc2]|nr:MAG: hypothetical protein D5R96_03135 [Methanocalculus sp. MSAO_Arc2]
MADPVYPSVTCSQESWHTEIQLRYTRYIIKKGTLLQNSDHQVFPEFFGTWEKIPSRDPDAATKIIR